MKIRPSIDTKVKLGDQLVLMGQRDALYQIDEMVKEDSYK